MRTIFYNGLAVDKTLNFVGDFFGLVFMLNFGVSSLNATLFLITLKKCHLG